MKTSRASASAFLAAAALTLAIPAGAQSYPSRPITLVVFLPAGAIPDLIGRLVGDALSQRLGQRKPVFVHSLICIGTLEERIDQLLESKRELVDKVMAASGEEWLGNLDLGAIRAAVALAPNAAEVVAA